MAGERAAQELDALLDREHRLLVVRVADDADDDAVEDPGRARDHVDVAVRDGVVRAGADRRDHASASKSVTRACPYFRDVRRGSGSSGSIRASVSTTSEAVRGEDGGQIARELGWMSGYMS